MSGSSNIWKWIGISVAVIVVVIGGLGYYAYSTFVKPIAEQSKVAIEEARTFAATTDNAGCVDGARARYANETNKVTSSVLQGVYLKSCLDNSATTPEFCAGVPSDDKQFQDSEWLKETCPGVGANDPGCMVMAATVVAHCRSTAKG